MTMKKWTSILLCLALLLTLAGSALASDVPENGIVKLYLWGEPSADDLAAIAYTEATYKIKVDYTVVAWGAMDVNVLTDISAGDAPDLLLMHAENFPRVAIQNLVMPVDQLDQELYNSAILATTAAASRSSYEYAGQKYAISGYGDPVYIFYNKTMFDDYGMDTPVELWERGEWTWEAFRQCAMDLMDYDAEGNATVYGYASWEYDIWVLSNGGTYLTYGGAEGIKLTLDDAATVRGLQFIQDGYYKDKYMKPDGNITHTTDFIAGRVGMISDGLYRVGDFIDVIKDEWDFVPMPLGPDNTTGAFPGTINGWAVCSSAKNPNGALMYLIGRAEYAEMTKESLSGINARLTPEQLERDRLYREGEQAANIVTADLAGIGNIANKQWDWWAAIFNGTPVATANETIRPVFQAEIDAAIADTKVSSKENFASLPVITFDAETADFFRGTAPDGGTWGTASFEIVDGLGGKCVQIMRNHDDEWQLMGCTDPNLWFFPSYGHTYTISFDYEMLSDMGDDGYIYLCLRPEANVGDGGVNFGWNTLGGLKAGDKGHWETVIGVDKATEPLCIVFGGCKNGDLLLGNISIVEN